jgi:hypothetical protein
VAAEIRRSLVRTSGSRCSSSARAPSPPRADLGRVARGHSGESSRAIDTSPRARIRFRFRAETLVEEVSMGQPNELPEGGEGGSTGGSWWWWRGPNPAELPVDFTRSLFEEVVSLRSRITGLENALTMVKITGRFGGIGGISEPRGHRNWWWWVPAADQRDRGVPHTGFRDEGDQQPYRPEANCIFHSDPG